MDYLLFSKINDLAGRWPLLDAFGVFCAKYFIFVLFALPCVYFLISRRKIILGLLIKIFAAASGLGWTINQIIGLIYFRPRPFVSHQVVQLVAKEVTSKSFPSDHAVLVFALAFVIYFWNKKIGAVFLFLAALVGLSRVFAGIHYPLDVLAGIIVAFASAWVIEKIADNTKFKLKRKKLVISFKSRIKFKGFKV